MCSVSFSAQAQHTVIIGTRDERETPSSTHRVSRRDSAEPARVRQVASRFILLTFSHTFDKSAVSDHVTRPSTLLRSRRAHHGVAPSIESRAIVSATALSVPESASTSSCTTACSSFAICSRRSVASSA